MSRIAKPVCRTLTTCASRGQQPLDQILGVQSGDVRFGHDLSASSISASPRFGSRIRPRSSSSAARARVGQSPPPASAIASSGSQTSASIDHARHVGLGVGELPFVIGDPPLDARGDLTERLYRGWVAKMSAGHLADPRRRHTDDQRPARQCAGEDLLEIDADDRHRRERRVQPDLKLALAAATDILGARDQGAVRLKPD